MEHPAPIGMLSIQSLSLGGMNKSMAWRPGEWARESGSRHNVQNNMKSVGIWHDKAFRLVTSRWSVTCDSLRWLDFKGEVVHLSRLVSICINAVARGACTYTFSEQMTRFEFSGSLTSGHILDILDDPD
jgi:hypothetical protein